MAKRIDTEARCSSAVLRDDHARSIEEQILVFLRIFLPLSCPTALTLSFEQPISSERGKAKQERSDLQAKRAQHIADAALR
jgi:hypothetical protein